MLFLNLPNELFHLVVYFLDYESEINALARTNQRLYRVANHLLYQHNIRHGNSSDLGWAVIHEAMPTFWLALREGAPVNALDSSFHCVAAACGKLALVQQLLVTYHYDANTRLRYSLALREPRNSTPLCWAADRGHADIVELLLARGAERTALFP